jgi:integrase/recombinase XerD
LTNLKEVAVDELFRRFIKEIRFIRNLTPKTISTYEQSWKVYRRFSSEINQPELNQFVIGMREAGISPGGCNTHIRSINSFLTWLHENDQLPQRLHIKLLKVERKVFRTFSDDQIKAILFHKAQSLGEHRLLTLLSLLTDTGIRITEALSLERDKVDFENLLIAVKGKGQKHRLVPISLEMRKRLWTFLKKHNHQLVFANRHGRRLLYDNLRRDLNSLCDKLCIQGHDGAFHAFRRKFARSYIRNGGNPFDLQQAMGHSNISTTKSYVDAEIGELVEAHNRTSLLNRLH